MTALFKKNKKKTKKKNKKTKTIKKKKKKKKKKQTGTPAQLRQSLGLERLEVRASICGRQKICSSVWKR